MDVQFMILAGGRGEGLQPLSDDCPPSLLQIKNYGRLIDFALYNCLLAPGGDVKVLTQYLSEAVEEHLRVFWSFNFYSNVRTLEILPGQFSNKGAFSDTADALFQVLLNEKQHPQHTVVLDSNYICKLDFNEIYDFHKSHPGRVTVGMVENTTNSCGKHDTLLVREDGFVHEIWQKGIARSDDLAATCRPANQVGVYIFETELLFKQLFANQLITSNNLQRDLLPGMIADNHVWGYSLNRHNPEISPHRKIATPTDYIEIQQEMNTARFHELYPESRKQAKIPLKTIHLLVRHEMERRELQARRGRFTLT